MNNPLKKITGIFLFIGILAAGYIVDVQFQWKKFADAGEHARQLEIQRQTLSEKISRIAQYQFSLMQTQKKFDQLKTTLPDAAHLPAFLNKITLSGKTKGLKFLTVYTGTPLRENFYQRVPVQLTLQGNYTQFRDYLNALNTAHYFVNFHNFTLVRQSTVAASVLNNEDVPAELLIKAAAVIYIFP
jgi:type IV pilus assembly protein PilO